MDWNCTIYINDIDQLKSFSHKYDVIWIIGGSSIYEQCIRNSNIVIEEVYITFINSIYNFDTKFPDLWLHNTVDENIGLKPSFDWSCSESIPPYATFEINPYAHYSIETIDVVNASSDCPELSFLKFKRIS